MGLDFVGIAKISDKMLKKFNLTIALAFLVALNLSVLGQGGMIRKEFLKIVPYVSTLEDVTRVYGQGHNIIKGREDYLSISYTINENQELSVDYFRNCNQADKPENERTWIVDRLFFTFEKDLKLKPEDIFINKKDFGACPYGDVGGQIAYFNKAKDIEFTYLSLIKAVTDLSVMAAEKNKERYKCKKDGVLFTLDPKGFRCSTANNFSR